MHDYYQKNNLATRRRRKSFMRKTIAAESKSPNSGKDQTGFDLWKNSLRQRKYNVILVKNGQKTTRRIRRSPSDNLADGGLDGFYDSTAVERCKSSFKRKEIKDDQKESKKTPTCTPRSGRGSNKVIYY